MLTARLVCVGRLKAGAERDLCTRYLDRAGAAGRSVGLAVDLREILESPARDAPARKSAEAAAIRSALGEKSPPFIVFDETGRSIRSLDFADIVRSALDHGVGALGLVIGGADGLDAGLRRDAQHVIGLGAMTWPHQLVRILVAEQIYRAVTILCGHPYHRA